MQQVQLFIKDQNNTYQRIELFDDETISLTESIQNVRDVSKVFTDFTKTFTIPATKNTNKLFKHYYNFDITGGFDARKKTDGLIKLNGIDFKTGKIKLEGVDLKENKAHSYKVTFIGELVNLKDLIGEDLLSDLWWLDNTKEDGTAAPTFVRDYSSAAIKSNLQGNNTTVSFINQSGSTETYLNAIKTALISNTKRLYYDTGADIDGDGNLYWHGGGGVHVHGVYWKDLKYSIAVYVIVKAIEKVYGITFSSDFFDYSNAEFSELMMLMHRSKGYPTASYSTGADLYFKYLDNQSTGEMTTFDLTHSGVDYTLTATALTTGVSISGFPEIPPAGWIWYYSYDIDLAPDDVSTVYSAYLYSDGNLVEKLEGVTGNQTFNNESAPNQTGNYNWTVKIECAETLTFGTGDIDISFKLWSFSGGTYTQVAPSTPSSNTATFEVEELFEFKPTQQLPEMKIIDFLTSLWKMFNLTAYVQDDGTIKVQKLDDFYTGGTSYDITKFVDVNSSQVNSALPYKQIDFEFEGSKTFLASSFKQLQNREFAKEEYKGEDPDNWAGGIYKVKLPLEKVVYERLQNESNYQTKDIQYGWLADENQEPCIGKPILHYAYLQNTGDISFMDDVDAHSAISTLFIPLNQRTTSDTTNSLNFYAELNEWSASANTNSLFELNYKTYIQSVFNSKKRLSKIKAFLPINILINYTLADTFIVAGKKYKINSITTNLQTGESDIELLNEV